MRLQYTPPPDRALTEREAAEYLGLSANTLSKMRCTGETPHGLEPIPFFRYSHRCIRYSLRALEKWRERYAATSTEEARRQSEVA